MLLGALPLVVVGLVLDGSEPRRALALGVGAAVSGTVYTALFLALAALTRHAVVIGLLYTLFWEGVLGSIFAGVRWLSVGAWGRGVAGGVSPLQADAAGTGVTYSVWPPSCSPRAAVWFTGDRLRSFTLRGDE